MPVYSPQDLPNAWARRWYRKGVKAGKRGRASDAYAAWESVKGKPKDLASGRAIEAKEYFLGGFIDGREARQNPDGWMRAKAVRIIRNRQGQAVALKIRR